MDGDLLHSLPSTRSCGGVLVKADSAVLSMDERGRLPREDGSTGAQDSSRATRTFLLPDFQVTALVAIRTLRSIQLTCFRGSWTIEDLGSWSIYSEREVVGTGEEAAREVERYED